MTTRLTTGLRWAALPAAVVSLLAAVPATAYPRPGRTEQLSVSPTGAAGAGAPDACSSSLTCTAEVDITPDGRFVAFSTVFDNLVEGDTNGVFDMFVRDLDTGVTERVSLGDGGQQANGASAHPSISDDGRSVAFASEATNLVATSGGAINVYVRDRVAGTTVLASIGPDGEMGVAGRASDNPRISGDGRYVAYSSDAFADDTTNDERLPFGGFNFGQVYVRDLQAQVTELVTVPDGGGRSTSVETYSSMVDISRDGRYVAFEARRHDLVAGDTNGMVDVFVRDRVARRTERVSVTGDGSQANWVSYNPRISADGRYVAFTSLASNLVPSDTNAAGRTAGGFDVFVHDRQAGTTRRVSVASSGAQTPAGHENYWLDLSPDGRFVAFDSTAPNLGGPEDFTRQVYVHDLATGRTDLASVPDGQSFLSTAFVYAPALDADAGTVAFVAPSATTPFSYAVYARYRGPALGVVRASVRRSGDVVAVEGDATFDGAVVTSAATVPAAPPGIGLAGASVVFRPEAEDLLVRFAVPGLPSLRTPVAGANYLAPASTAGVPGAVHLLRFDAGERRFEVRATRDGAEPSFSLHDCTDACAQVAALEGGYGTTGEEISVSLPFALLGIAPGTTLASASAAAGIGTGSTGQAHEVQRLSLPDGVIPAPSVRVSAAGDTVTATLSGGRFSASLMTPDTLDGSAATVTACLGDRCSDPFPVGGSAPQEYASPW